MLKTNRGLAKFFFLSLITFGIYGIVVLFNVSKDINTIASQRDGKHTMNYLLIYFIFSWLTLGIAPLVWFHRISNRIGASLRHAICLIASMHLTFGCGVYSAY